MRRTACLDSKAALLPHRIHHYSLRWESRLKNRKNALSPCASCAGISEYTQKPNAPRTSIHTTPATKRVCGFSVIFDLSFSAIPSIGMERFSAGEYATLFGDGDAVVGSFETVSVLGGRAMPGTLFTRIQDGHSFAQMRPSAAMKPCLRNT
jgi:hypothetical protein